MDAQLSPALAPWIAQTFKIDAQSVRYVGFRDAEDSAIFFAAREAGAIVMTKDQDFIALVRQHGPPPPILWVRCGNTSNVRLRGILNLGWESITTAFAEGDTVVELWDAR